MLDTIVSLRDLKERKATFLTKLDCASGMDRKDLVLGII